MAKVNLIIYKENTSEEVQYTVRKASVFNLIKVNNEINEVIKAAAENEAIRTALAEAFNVAGTDQEQSILNDYSKIGRVLVGAFETIAVTLPEQALKILSSLSGIPEDVLREQGIEEICDVFDAIVAENDFNRLSDRVKKSFGLAKSQLSGLAKAVASSFRTSVQEAYQRQTMEAAEPSSNE